MIIRKSAIAVAAAMAMLFSIGASGATRQEAMAAKTAARTGGGAKLGTTLNILQQANARRPQSDVVRAFARKIPALFFVHGEQAAGECPQLGCCRGHPLLE